MNKRLTMLEQMVASGKADSFARYALALEYKKEGRDAEALSTFEGLRDGDPEYLPQYLMAGQLLLEQGRKAEAAEWLRQGIPIAEQKGDGKAISELSDALAEATE